MCMESWEWWELETPGLTWVLARPSHLLSPSPWDIPRALSQNIRLLDLIVTLLSEIVLHLESQNRFTEEMYLHDNLHNFVYFVGGGCFVCSCPFLLFTHQNYSSEYLKKKQLIIEWNKGLYKDLRKNLRMFFKVNSWLERKKANYISCKP